MRLNRVGTTMSPFWSEKVNRSIFHLLSLGYVIVDLVNYGELPLPTEQISPTEAYTGGPVKT